MDPDQIAAKDDSQKTALLWAAYGGHKDVVALLLDKNPDLIAAKDEEGLTALHLAALNGHRDVVALLLDGMGSAAKDRRGRTALHWAAWKGHSRVVALLVERMDPDQIAAKDGYGLASILRRPSLLLDRMWGAAKGRRRRTALHLAAECGHREVVALLERACEEENGIRGGKRKLSIMR